MPRTLFDIFAAVVEQSSRRLPHARTVRSAAKHSMMLTCERGLHCLHERLVPSPQTRECRRARCGAAAGRESWPRRRPCSLSHHSQKYQPYRSSRSSRWKRHFQPSRQPKPRTISQRVRQSFPPRHRRQEVGGTDSNTAASRRNLDELRTSSEITRSRREARLKPTHHTRTAKAPTKPPRTRMRNSEPASAAGSPIRVSHSAAAMIRPGQSRNRRRGGASSDPVRH
jgi:hypothetical protein